MLAKIAAATAMTSAPPRSTPDARRFAQAGVTTTTVAQGSTERRLPRTSVVKPPISALVARQPSQPAHAARAQPAPAA